MYLGVLVEITTSDRLYADPLHPYTRALLSAVPLPDPDAENGRERVIILQDFSTTISCPQPDRI